MNKPHTASPPVRSASELTYNTKLEFELGVISRILLLGAYALTWVACADPCPLALLLQKRLEPTAEILLRDLPAVHATDILPTDGTLRAGAAHFVDGQIIEIPGARKTLHFSLGSLATPAPGKVEQKWDGKKFAIVMPLGALKDQLLNLNTHDTFIFGDLALPAGATVLVPKGTAFTPPNGVNVVTYTPKEGLREAVDRVIAERQMLSIRLAAGGGRRLQPGRVGEQDVNREDFFQPLLEEMPWLSFGEHQHSLAGEAYRLGVIDAVANGSIAGLRSLDSSALRLRQALIDHHLEKFREVLEWTKAPSRYVETLKELQARTEGIQSLLKRELHLRLRGQSLSDPNLLLALTSVRNDPHQTRKLMAEWRDSLPEAPRPRPDSVNTLAELTAAMRYSEAVAFLKKNDVDVDWEDFREAYDSKRGALGLRPAPPLRR